MRVNFLWTVSRNFSKQDRGLYSKCVYAVYKYYPTYSLHRFGEISILAVLMFKSNCLEESKTLCGVQMTVDGHCFSYVLCRKERESNKVIEQKFYLIYRAPNLSYLGEIDSTWQFSGPFFFSD